MCVRVVCVGYLGNGVWGCIVGSMPVISARRGVVGRLHHVTWKRFRQADAIHECRRWGQV